VMRQQGRRKENNHTIPATKRRRRHWCIPIVSAAVLYFPSLSSERVFVFVALIVNARVPTEQWSTSLLIEGKKMHHRPSGGLRRDGRGGLPRFAEDPFFHHRNDDFLRDFPTAPSHRRFVHDCWTKRTASSNRPSTIPPSIRCRDEVCLYAQANGLNRNHSNNKTVDHHHKRILTKRV
jgi:hypothetical protein